MLALSGGKDPCRWETRSSTVSSTCWSSICKNYQLLRIGLYNTIFVILEITFQPVVVEKKVHVPQVSRLTMNSRIHNYLSFEIFFSWPKIDNVHCNFEFKITIIFLFNLAIPSGSYQACRSPCACTTSKLIYIYIYIIDFPNRILHFSLIQW